LKFKTVFKQKSVDTLTYRLIQNSVNAIALKNKLFHLALVISVLCLTLTGYAAKNQILTGADQPDLYLSKLKGKKLALVVNQTSRIGNQHLVDFLLEKKLTIKRIFAPEHGFRGEAGAGELIDNSKDRDTGIPIISVYGKNRKASKEQLSGIDIVLFDIQDVGCRFYTYISTLHYMMEACAENNITLLILDRPNPTAITSMDQFLSPPSNRLSEWTQFLLYMVVQLANWHR